MSDSAGQSRKRALSLESEGEDGQTDRNNSYADPETLAKRRIVRICRPPPRESAPSLNGAFKAVSSISPADVPALPTKLEPPKKNSDDVLTPGATPFHNGDALKPTAPGSPFSFFGKPPTGESAPFSRFTFGFDKGSTEEKKNNDNTTSGGSGNSSEATTGKPLFAGLFDFANAAGSFVEAKKRMAEEEADAQQKTTEVSPNAATPGEALVNAAPVFVSTGKVLACVPSKLFLFKSDSKSWAECGTGDAKIKSHEATDDGDGVKEPKCRYRLIVRDGYSLNAPLCGYFRLTKAEDTHAIFTIPTGDKVATYLLKYTGPQAESRGTEFSKVLKETLKLTQEDSK